MDPPPWRASCLSGGQVPCHRLVTRALAVVVSWSSPALRQLFLQGERRTAPSGAEDPRCAGPACLAGRPSVDRPWRVLAWRASDRNHGDAPTLAHGVLRPAHDALAAHEVDRPEVARLATPATHEGHAARAQRRRGEVLSRLRQAGELEPAGGIVGHEDIVGDTTTRRDAPAVQDPAFTVPRSRARRPRRRERPGPHPGRRARVEPPYLAGRLVERWSDIPTDQPQGRPVGHQRRMVDTVQQAGSLGPGIGRRVVRQHPCTRRAGRIQPARHPHPSLVRRGRDLGQRERCG
jgi:hypothetical protein